MTSYGFDWGPLTVERTAHIEGHGYVLTVKTAHRRIEVYVTEAGRVIRVFTPGAGEWVRPGDGRPGA